MEDKSSDKVLLTRKGLDEINKEYQERKEKKIKLNDDVNRARAEGDLRENGAYSAAILERQVNETRIIELRRILASYQIAEHSNTHSNVIQIGSIVKVKTVTNIEKSFIIVGANEANPMEGKISIDSPIGKELINKKVGNQIKVSTEKSSTTYDIIDVKN